MVPCLKNKIKTKIRPFTSIQGQHQHGQYSVQHNPTLGFYTIFSCAPSTAHARQMFREHTHSDTVCGPRRGNVVAWRHLLYGSIILYCTTFQYKQHATHYSTTPHVIASLLCVEVAPHVVVSGLFLGVGCKACRLESDFNVLTPVIYNLTDLTFQGTTKKLCQKNVGVYNAYCTRSNAEYVGL